MNRANPLIAAAQQALRPVRVKCAALLLVMCVAPVTASAPQSFDPISFFSGATDSTGTLKQAFASAKITHVAGWGALRRPGIFVLDQTMTIAGEPVRTRQWQLHQISPGHFGGTVSDASGPVTIDVVGNRLIIKYAMKGGLNVTSVLAIAPDGRSGRNESRIKKWGMGVATLSEVIVKR